MRASSEHGSAECNELSYIYGDYVIFVSFTLVPIIYHLQEFFFFTDDLDERRLKRGPSSEGGKLILNVIEQNSLLSFMMTNVSIRY